MCTLNRTSCEHAINFADIRYVFDIRFYNISTVIIPAYVRTRRGLFNVRRTVYVRHTIPDIVGSKHVPVSYTHVVLSLTVVIVIDYVTHITFVYIVRVHENVHRILHDARCTLYNRVYST